ncbi:MAG: ABC transporter ATP-binding protein, partial [Nitratireductor sp.]|nr:ABC transporter ATP-binding protein [Nitratireductor sp.]
SLGEVAFSIALVLRLSLLLNRLMGILNGFFRNVGVTQNSMELIARPLEITDAPDAKELQPGDGGIEVDDITFNYGKATGSGREGLFDHFSLAIARGEKVGIVGPSGAGKSTLVNLMLRFFELEAGAIRVNGQDIRSVTQDSLRAAFSMVQQDTAMFHRSVRENIAHGRPGASNEEIVAAAKKANAHDFILQLEDRRGRKGYDAHVGERGVQLSGGQRQRIAIARVFLRDAPILILDEATSQLDSGVEAAIRENLDPMMAGRTVIAIAHRLSTLAEMDRLVVIDAGRIVEEGTHRTLLKRGGLYAALWKRQAGGFLPIGE